MASDFEDFIGFVGRIVLVDPRNLKPLTIVIFADDSEFDPFKPLTSDGRNMSYVPQEILELQTGSTTRMRLMDATIAMAVQDHERETRHAAFYGGVCWYLNGLKVPAPPRSSAERR